MLVLSSECSDMLALGNMGWCLMKNGQSGRALPLMERSLSISREYVAGDHLHLANGEILVVSIILERLYDSC